MSGGTGFSVEVSQTFSKTVGIPRLRSGFKEGTLDEEEKETKKGFGMPPETPGACHKSELEKARLNSRSNYCRIYGPLN